MILIDAVFIHDGGGRVLLDYLISHLLKEKGVKIVYLLDKRMENNHTVNDDCEIHFAKGFSERCTFYNKNKHRFTKVFCFGNIPPHLRLKAEVIVYMHGSLYLTDIVKGGLKQMAVSWTKKQIFYALRNNADYWGVQTAEMKKLLHRKLNLSGKKVEIIPFYNAIKYDQKLRNAVVRESNSFLYVSLPTPHKNHKRLIEAFCLFYDRQKIGKLIVTVDDSNLEIYNLIKDKIKSGYPIYNIGIIPRESLPETYLKSEFLYYPSLRESFGLPLIEASGFDCKIVAADMEYVKNVCEASLTFDPENTESMAKAFELAVSHEISIGKCLVSDEIQKLVVRIIC